MDIREIDELNMPELWKLWVRALHDHPEAFGADYEWAKDVSPEESQALLRQIREGGGFILGAMNAETLIGEVCFTRQQGEKFCHKGDIGAVYVIPEQRGKGFAKALLLAALEQTRTITDLAIISLSVNAENKSAINLYEACGFKAYGVEPKGLCVNGKYIDLLHMTY
jgi:RimJ/RimL family protein N-acetyltransferase